MAAEALSHGEENASLKAALAIAYGQQREARAALGCTTPIGAG